MRGRVGYRAKPDRSLQHSAQPSPQAKDGRASPDTPTSMMNQDSDEADWCDKLSPRAVEEEMAHRASNRNLGPGLDRGGRSDESS